MGIWVTLIIIILATPVLLTVIKSMESLNAWPTVIVESYLYVWGIFCQQGLSGKQNVYDLCA